MEVAQLVGQGLQNRAIGKRLFISEQTVNFHILNTNDKFGVYDRVELMLYSIHHWFIDKPNGPYALAHCMRQSWFAPHLRIFSIEDWF